MFIILCLINIVVISLVVLIHHEALFNLSKFLPRLATPRHQVLVGLIGVLVSFTVYTSLGFGDIVPIGDLRFLCGLESLIGLVMIAWSASFMYMEMRKNW